MDNLCGILIFILFVGGIVFLTFLQSEDIKNRIKAEVKAHGGSDIEISSANRDGDKGNFTYNVSFVDAYNRRHQTQCKARSLSFNDALYWTHSPKELMQPDPAVVALPQQPYLTSSKEQIITDLTAENKRLQAEINRLAQESNE